MTYGEKRDYPKIDIYFMGSYQASTTWARTLKEAKASFAKKAGLSLEFITAKFDR